MDPLTSEVVIDAPRERVFDFVADLANHPAFLDHFISEFRLARLDSSGPGASARFRIDAPVSVLAIWGEVVIEEVERPHRIRARGAMGRLGRIPCQWLYEFVETDGGLTRASLTTCAEPGHPLDRLRERLGARGWLRRRQGRALHRLRDLLESPEPVVGRVGTAGGNRLATGIR